LPEGERCGGEEERGGGENFAGSTCRGWNHALILRSLHPKMGFRRI
jgi:hypothetical protein